MRDCSTLSDASFEAEDALSRSVSEMAILESAGINRYEAGVEETLRDKD